jgi:flavodoxin
MKTNLYYFSGTGNCLQVSRDLARELGEAQVISLPRALAAGATSAADCTGIVFPTYFGGLPLVVARFLGTLRPAGYTFAITACGATPGAALPQAAALLRANGVSLAAGFHVPMPGNYIRLYDARPEKKQ